MLHIILIDDDSITNFLNKKIILKSGLARSIKAFESGSEALDYLKDVASGERPETFPDLILLDIMMPVMDGFEVLDELMKLPAGQTQKLRVIMLSSSLDKRDWDRAGSYAMVEDFLSKPLTNENIEKALSAKF